MTDAVAVAARAKNARRLRDAAMLFLRKVSVAGWYFLAPDRVNDRGTRDVRVC
jgi:hypothetical protein